MAGRRKQRGFRLSAEQQRQQRLAESLKGFRDRRGKNSALYLLLSASTGFMAGFDARSIRQRVRDSMAAVRIQGFRIADADIWHVLAANLHALRDGAEVQVLARELGADRQLVNFAFKQVLRDCLAERRLNPELLAKLNALRLCVSLPKLGWDDRRLAEARVRVEKEGTL